VKLNDLNEASFGSALMTQLGKKLNPFDKSGESQMSVKDRMRQQQFVQDFVGNAAANLAQGIQGGVVDPNPKSGSTPQPTATPAAASVATPDPTKAPSVADTIGQTRIDKQKAAAAAAQSQMAANPVPAKPEAPVQKTHAEIRQAKQAAAAQKANREATPFSKVKTAPRVWKSNRNPNMAAKATPRFESLNNVFESIMNIDEAGQYAYTISSYLENFIRQYMKGVDTSSLKPMIDAVQATYAQDKGRKALQKLASAAYSVYQTGGQGANASDTQASTTAPASVGDALSAGLKAGLSGASEPSSAQPGTSSAQPASSPAKVKSVYNQVKELMQQLNKQQKGFILKQLSKELGSATSAPAASNPSGYSDVKMNAPTGIPKPTTPAVKAKKIAAKKAAVQKPEPLSIGKQKISPDDPLYSKIMKKVPQVAEHKVWGQK
jgi:hypothetical protein